MKRKSTQSHECAGIVEESHHFVYISDFKTLSDIYFCILSIQQCYILLCKVDKNSTWKTQGFACLWLFLEVFFKNMQLTVVHSFMTFTKSKEGDGVGDTKFWPILASFFSYTCGRPHIQLVNLFLSVIYKNFLHLLGFLVLHCFLEAL